MAVVPWALGDITLSSQVMGNFVALMLIFLSVPLQRRTLGDAVRRGLFDVYVSQDNKYNRIDCRLGLFYIHKSKDIQVDEE